MRADTAPLKSVVLHMVETANGCNTQLVKTSLLPGQSSTKLFHQIQDNCILQSKACKHTRAEALLTFNVQYLHGLITCCKEYVSVSVRIR